MKKPENPVLEDLRKGKLHPVQKKEKKKNGVRSRASQPGLCVVLKHMTAYTPEHHEKKKNKYKTILSQDWRLQNMSDTPKDILKMLSNGDLPPIKKGKKA